MVITTPFPTDEAQCAADELVWWSTKIAEIAEGRCRQPMSPTCPTLALRQKIRESRELLARALATLEHRQEASR